MDEQQVIEDAVEVLRQVTDRSPDPQLSALAKELLWYIHGPIMSSGSEPSPDELKRRYAEAMRTKPREFVKAAARSVEKRGPAYKTRIFKCLEDFENCKRHGVSSNVCLAMMILCVGQQLIPFTK